LPGDQCLKETSYDEENIFHHIEESVTREGYGLAYQKGFEITVRFLLSRGAQRECATEAAQGAWVRGWEQLHQLRDDTKLLFWVNSIALNAYRRLTRREALSRELREIVSPRGIDTARIDVRRILNCCRPSERILFEQQICGATNAEIARAQGVTETAIRIRLLRARRMTRSRLERRTVVCPKPLTVVCPFEDRGC
jgi:DNA-directed RNA polymerase specialized sigma24 family protein